MTSPSDAVIDPRSLRSPLLSIRLVKLWSRLVAVLTLLVCAPSVVVVLPSRDIARLIRRPVVLNVPVSLVDMPLNELVSLLTVVPTVLPVVPSVLPELSTLSPVRLTNCPADLLIAFARRSTLSVDANELDAESKTFVSDEVPVRMLRRLLTELLSAEDRPVTKPSIRLASTQLSRSDIAPRLTSATALAKDLPIRPRMVSEFPLAMTRVTVPVPRPLQNLTLVRPMLAEKSATTLVSNAPGTMMVVQHVFDPMFLTVPL